MGNEGCLRLGHDGMGLSARQRVGVELEAAEGAVPMRIRQGGHLGRKRGGIYGFLWGCSGRWFVAGLR